MKKFADGFFAMLQNLVGLDRNIKLAFTLMSDTILCIVAVIIGFSLRLGEWQLWNSAISTVAIVALLIWWPISLSQGIYRTVVRFIGSRTMIAIVMACGGLSLGMIAFFAFNPTPGVPRTIALIQPIIFAGLLVFSRLFARYILFDVLGQQSYIGSRYRVFIYGAGAAGRQLALALRHEPSMHLVGYLDDDDRLSRTRVDGMRVHPGKDVEKLISQYRIDMVLLALPRVSRQRREQIIRKFESSAVRVMTLPAMSDLLDGSVSVGDLREIRVEDLLGREPVPPNRLLMHKTVGGKTVLITGAGGSIGSELCRQIIHLAPAQIILVEMTEHALYAIEEELRECQKEDEIAVTPGIFPELCNVADPDSVMRIFQRWKPDTIFHAAAYKHVPLVEENAVSGMWNNIFGTLNCALAAEEVGTKNFILISTDKAVRPTSVMGASKRVCELILQGLAERGTKTVFTMVRFGNVLGSSGSVVPRFERQIRQGGPVTLTHREITRYFMTIPEASQLVIQAGAMAQGGEVYVLDMGEPVRIYELARTMIHLSGYSVREAGNPNGDVEIIEVGLRKGEKLFEELLIGNSPKQTRHARIMQAREESLPWNVLRDHLDDLARRLRLGDKSGALTILHLLVPEYNPSDRACLTAQPEQVRQ